MFRTVKAFDDAVYGILKSINDSKGQDIPFPTNLSNNEVKDALEYIKNNKLIKEENINYKEKVFSIDGFYPTEKGKLEPRLSRDGLLWLEQYASKV